MKALYVIGNGFDLHHGMKTAYQSFREFVKLKSPGVHRKVDRFLDVNEYWSDLEDALATLDLNDVVDDAGQFLTSYGSDEWSDSGHHDYQYELEETIASLSTRLLALFEEWVRGVEVPSRAKVQSIMTRLDPDARYLSFNYTNTLEVIYGISPMHILHIHGCVTEPDCKLILGHAWEPEEATPGWLDHDSEDMDVRVREGNEILKPYFLDTFKPSAKIIERHQAWFQELEDVSEVRVLGHSLSDVDRLYFVELCNNIQIEKVVWQVSCRDEPEPKKEAFLMGLGVPRHLIRFKLMTEF